MENQKKAVTHLSEEIVTEILARLPLRSISRFKLVCRTWKSIVETLYFRRLFLSLHKKASRSWSLESSLRRLTIDFHRCQTWGLPNSISYYFWNILRNSSIRYVDSSNGLVLMQLGCYDTIYVGNPILQQWVVIPDPNIHDSHWNTSLVTRVDEDGVVLSFKVVAFHFHETTRSEDMSSICLYFSVYSSETGIWTPKQLHCSHYNLLYPRRLLTLHGMLYIGDSREGDRGVIFAHDFYGDSNVCRVIPLPDRDNNKIIFERTFTTSTDFFIYLKTLGNNVLKVWRLLDNSDWEPLWETRLMIFPSADNIISFEPLRMHPFNRNIVYLWSSENDYLVSYNWETQNYQIFTDQIARW